MSTLIATTVQSVGVHELVPVVAVAALGAAAGTLAVLAANRGLLIPAVAIELILGVIVGPQVLGLEVTTLTEFFKTVGLGLLFFFAGYEIDFKRIRGGPLNRAGGGWVISLAIAYSAAALLAIAGVVISPLYTGSALATTAIGTLIPILSDSGELKTRLGTNLLAAGAVGEFGPILLLTLLLTTASPLSEAMLMALFIAVAVAVAMLAVRSSQQSVPLLQRSAELSSQIAVRWFFVLVLALVLLAAKLHLDLLIGGFAAGMIARQMLGKAESAVFESKLTAVAFGVFVPFFFVVSGQELDVASLFVSASAMLKVPLFFLLFLVVRGTPALLLYKKELPHSDRVALAFFSATQLPLVLAITTVAHQAGHMRSTTAAALVSAALLSTLFYPLAGLMIKRRDGSAEAATA
ncbi:MAG: cation:proton antiporter [Actinobacteria bacterium]|uniref:Unannotated protein n=1 Tax=freshwater metagenome TaxID=449393 RepID=A0A6J7EC19_9ZZZZ|nr:cation:proton antiporter [Actinomycetota bacterium]